MLTSEKLAAEKDNACSRKTDINGCLVVKWIHFIFGWYGHILPDANLIVLKWNCSFRSIDLPIT